MLRSLWFSAALSVVLLAVICLRAEAAPALAAEGGDQAARQPLSLALPELAPLEQAPLPGVGGIQWERQPAKLTLPVVNELRSWRLPRRLVAGSEIALILGFAGADYWRRQDGLPPWGLSDWRDRVSTTSWLILDTSPFVTNYSFHTVAGASYHLATRTSDLGMLESALWSIGSSVAWEYVVEYRQKADLNDMIFTTPAGLAAGEFAYSLGRLLQQQGSGRGWDIARWTLGFPQSFNDAVHGEDSPRGTPVSHRFQVAVGASGASALATGDGGSDRAHAGLYQVRAAGALATMDELYAPGRGWRGFRDGNFTSLDVLVTGGVGGNSGTYVLSDTMLAGWHYSDIAQDVSRGRTLTLGSSTAVRYQREQFGPWRDRLGMAHFPGLAADGHMWGDVGGHPWRFRGTARLHPDYGGVHAVSGERWIAEHPDERGWSTVEEQGYYHAYGVSGRLSATLEVPWVLVGGELFLGRYQTHRFRDKIRSQITIKQEIASRFADYGLWLRAALPAQLFVEMRLDSRHRWERFEEFDTRARLRRYGLELGTTF